ncbi:MAG: hypothetical protein ACRELY_00320 [Polyangiaceae bacterium]
MALFVGLSTMAAPARAQEGSDQAVAQALFDQARELMQKKDYAHACVLLEKSESLDPGGGTLLNLAVCYEGQGSLARAYATYQEALSEAHREGRKDRADTATKRIDALAGKVPRLLIHLPDQASNPNLVVQVDDTIMGSAIIGVATLIDPGAHHVRVSLYGRKPWTWDGSIEEGKTVEISPDLPLLENLPPPCASEPCAVVLVPQPPPPAIAPAPQTPPPDRERSRRAVGSYVLGGVAIAATATTVVTGILALNAQSSYKSQCLPDRGFCSDPAAAESDASRARTMAWVSTISLGVAAAAFLGALLWPDDKLYDQMARAPMKLTISF